MPTILHFDDDTRLTTKCAALFQDEGYVYISYTSPGDDPVGIVVHEKPDVILMDVVMPGMDGFEAAQRIKSDVRARSIPLIFLTSLGQMDYVGRGTALGAAGYLVKSESSLREVVSHVKAIIAEGSVELNK